MDARILKVIVGLIVLAVSLLTPPKTQSPKLEKATVQNSSKAAVAVVLDGDTVDLVSSERIRYIGIDAPEIVHSGKRGECFANQSRNENSVLVLNKDVRLEKDVSETDKYKRLLRYVFVKDTSGKEIFVNEYLIRNGFAFIATYPPDVKYVTLFKEAQEEARLNKRGLWGKCAYE